MNPESYETRESIAQREVTREVARGGGRPWNLPAISWGAVFAGLFVILSLSWLIQMLGMAIGLTIADATDSITMDGTLTPAVSIWTLICWLVSFFVGALVTARLAGRIDDAAGMLHGFTVWSVATAVMVVLAYWGIGAFVQTGTTLAGQAVQGVGTAATAVASGVGQAASGAATLTEQIATQYGERIQDRLYDRAAEIAASSSEEVTEEEIRAAISDIDARTLRRIVIDLTNDDTEGAAELVAQHTKLSVEDAQSLIDATYQELKEQIGNPDSQQTLAQDVRNRLVANFDSYLAGLDAAGPPNVTEQDIQDALNELDGEAAQKIAMQLMNGDAEGAKRTLARNTSLSSAQITELVEGASEGINEEIAAYQEAIDETLETVSTYTASLFWLIFAGAAAALAAAIGGGYMGADSSRRVYPHEYGNRTATPVRTE